MSYPRVLTDTSIQNFSGWYSSSDRFYINDNVDNGKYSICPRGWALPTNNEFRRLSGYSGNKFKTNGGYLQDYSIVTGEGSTSRYVSQSLYKDSYNYNYTYDFFFDLGASNYTTSFRIAGGNTTENAKNLKFAASVRCIARKDKNANNPKGNYVKYR